MNEPCFYRISVKGLVTDTTGRILLAREDNGKWELLGGGLEHDEAPLDGLRREIQEEAGLIVTNISPTPKYFFTAQRLGKANYFANIIYEIELSSLDFTPSEECQELRFFTLDEMRLLDSYTNLPILIDLLAAEAN